MNLLAPFMISLKVYPFWMYCGDTPDYCDSCENRLVDARAIVQFGPDCQSGQFALQLPQNMRAIAIRPICTVTCGEVRPLAMQPQEICSLDFFLIQYLCNTFCGFNIPKAPKDFFKF